ncbi:MAG: ABC transporter permease [Spirochaetales bacterium]|nr:MAG: ABC transporter permease [Spirochaetales bacterium]
MTDFSCVEEKEDFGKRLIKLLFNNKVVFAFLLIIVLFIIGQIVVPGFAKFNHVMSVLQAAFFLGLVGLGQTIVVISGKEGLDMSVGANVSVGVVMVAAIINGNNLNLPPAILAIFAAGFALGLINGIGISLLNIAPLIMTLAWGIVIEGLLLFIIKGHMFGTGSSALELLGNGSLNIGKGKIPSAVLIWSGIILVMHIFLTKTKPGQTLYAVGENDKAASFMGIKVKRFRIIIYGISGALSAITGLLLLGFVGSAHLNLGARYVLPSVVAVIIGGIRFGGGAGNYLGTVAGAIFLTTLQSILVTLDLSEGGKQLITGAVLILLLLAYTRRGSK